MRIQKWVPCWIGIVVCAVYLHGCVAAPPKPTEIVAPEPILGNSGMYMCPFTQDDVLAKWCDKSINASMGSTVGKAAGAYVGAKALEQVPFVGGFVGSMAGEAIGRKIAIEAAGGEEYIRETSDLSFRNVEDMAVWLYVNKHDHEHYQAAIKATGEIYPDFQKKFQNALLNAKRK